MTTKFTDKLMGLDQAVFRRATQHPWLRLIGQDKLPREHQLEWLLQDRIYALSYVSFAAHLLGKVSLPYSSDRAKSLEWRISDMLIEALNHIRSELEMFESTLKNHFDWGKDKIDTVQAATPTRLYQHLFHAAIAPNVPLVVGLTAMWGTERCYLESWRFAKQQQTTTRTGQQSKDEVDVVRTILIPNWTSTEFESFVDDIADLLNELAARDTTTDGDIAKCEEMWKQILWCEEQFWPRVDE